MTVKEILEVIPKGQKVVLMYAGHLRMDITEETKEFLNDIVLDGEVNEITCLGYAKAISISFVIK